MLVLWTRFASFAHYLHMICCTVCSEFSWKSVYKWCWFVKTIHKCQNGGGFKMSKWCRYVKTLQVYFVKMVQVQKNFDRRRTIAHHHLLIHTTNASLIIERSKCTIKQSEDWLMPTVNPNIYLRDGRSLVNLLRLFCLLYSFVLLLPNNRFSKYWA